MSGCGTPRRASGLHRGNGGGNRAGKRARGRESLQCHPKGVAGALPLVVLKSLGPLTASIPALGERGSFAGSGQQFRAGGTTGEGRAMRRRSGRDGDQGPLLALRSRERGLEWYCGAARQGILPRGQGGAKVRAKVGRVNGSRRLPGG